MTTKIKKADNTIVDLRSTKARQTALQSKINEIDEELKNLDITNLKYTLGTIANPEILQNTINIGNITDTSFIIRLIAYYENIVETKNKLIKDGFNFPEGFILKQNNGYNIYTIIQELKLRLTTLLNSEKITILTKAKEKLLPFLNEESRFISTLQDVTKMFAELNS